MSQFKWVEIIEPGSGRKVYANTETGQCLWKPPKGEEFKPCSDDQWWELTDPGTGRCYYYNATTKSTVWERPATGDIVSLSRLQEAQKELMEHDQQHQQQSEPVQQSQNHTAQPHSDHTTASSHPEQQRHLSHSGSLQSSYEQESHQSEESGPPSPQRSFSQSKTPPAVAPKPPKTNYGDVATSSPDLKTFKHNLNTHKKGIIFKRKVSLHNMLSWSPAVIPRPMLLTLKKDQKKLAIDMFKLIQQYMGDRNAKGKSTAQVGAAIIGMCWDEGNSRLRDELFVQLCKQTTGNSKTESCEKGWELLAVALSFFPPTLRFFEYLKGYIAKHTESTQGDVGFLAESCFNRLDRIHRTGRKQGAKLPSDEDIEVAVRKIKNPSVFGSSLDEVMAMQEEAHPDLEIPLVLQTLSNAVLHHGGASTEGIFRVPGDIDGVNRLKLLMDKGEEATGLNEPHVPASALKLWFRELVDPVIPEEFYQQCMDASNNAEAAIDVVNALPTVNRNIVLFITRFLQNIGRPENQSATKMSYDNLSMVWAPNFLRCPDEDPLVIFNNTKKEMAFVRQLVLNLDTSSVEHLFT